jgi:hypothetical protein
MAHKIGTFRPSRQELPETLLIGEFSLMVDNYTAIGRWDPARRVLHGVSGTAWTGFACGPWPLLEFMAGDLLIQPRIETRLEVVAEVRYPQTQVGYDLAHQIQSDIQVGQTLDLAADMSAEELAGLIRADNNLLDWLKESKKKGQIRVQFEGVSIQAVPGNPKQGRIISGEAVYPSQDQEPATLRLTLDGFTAKIDRLVLTPDLATADVTLLLPKSIAAADTCGSAILHLGETPITIDCQLYVDRPTAEFGPWIVGDTGMMVKGIGYTADFSSYQSPLLKPPAWKGLVLASGTTSGSGLVSPNSNTGYLAADFAFSKATVTSSGFQGQLWMVEACKFEPVHPSGYLVEVEGGMLEVADSRVISGLLGPGTVVPPRLAACNGIPGQPIKARFAQLTVQADLDLNGEVIFEAGAKMAWGELTHPGSELIAWILEVRKGYFCLPACPLPSFTPETSSTFLDLFLPSNAPQSLAKLNNLGMAGITVTDMQRLQILSPDRPHGTANPLVITNPRGWLRIGGQGVDGEIQIIGVTRSEELGDETRTGYLATRPFQANLFHNDKRVLLAQFIASAVYHSQLDGTVAIPDEPCKIPPLDFTGMQITSTANLVGGNLILPLGGVVLDYWQVSLVPTGDPAQAGVVSVRTGRLVFTAAGISEPVHFARPFGLTWGEFLADGNVGELFFDHNSYGQRFDNLPFTPSYLALSPYRAGTTDAYLAASGTVHINFFGPHFVNIHDARYHETLPPYKSRKVTVPKPGEASCPATDLHMEGHWDDCLGRELATFDFPDATVDYHEKAQNGFLGTGTSGILFLQSNGLDATIEVHGDAIDVCLSSEDTHDLDVGLFARLGGMSGTYGCARIEGPLLQRVSLFGYLEQSAAAGLAILAPKAGFVIEINITTTPSSFDFYASGDLLLSVAGAAVDVSASIHLFLDYARGSAEGEINGKIDCNSAVGGLEGEGQLTWYMDGSTQYLQGKLKMAICGWTGGVGLEGGLFLGNNVNRARAWVLYAGGEKFGISDAVLPDVLTGIFGYGQISFGVQWYIFGGGIEVFAGVGFFDAGLFGHCGIHVYGEILGGLVSASAWASLALMAGIPLYFEGSFGLEGCVLWVICASIEVTAGFGSNGFYLN